MTQSSDKEHFEDYRKQTQVKHDILKAYISSYYHVLKTRHKNLVFIDGFAGRGTYTKADNGESFKGSPLLALELIAEREDFTNQVSTIFIESNPELFEQLNSQVTGFYKNHPAIRKPICLFGTFKERIQQILNALKGVPLAPTFLFVDPCGVAGTDLDTIRAIMEYRRCEVFIFFNINAVRRVVGLSELSDVLVECMGTAERAKALCDEFRVTADARARERLILDHYCNALREDIGIQYLNKFRVEHEDRQTASHYFIHATKHPLGFKIMKDVMWSRGQSEYGEGALELRQSGRTNIVPLFDMSGNEKEKILTALKGKTLPVSTFYSDWTMNPDNQVSQPAYRQMLLELEAEGRIVVLKDRTSLCSVDSRKKYKGKPTLGETYFVRLASLE